MEPTPVCRRSDRHKLSHSLSFSFFAPFTEPVESCTRLLRHDPHSSLIAADLKGTLFSILPIPHSRGLHAIFCLICFAVIYDHFGGSVRDDSNMIRTCKSPCGRSVACAFIYSTSTRNVQIPSSVDGISCELGSGDERDPLFKVRYTAL